MLIRAYGLFWRADEVDWHPGKGRKGAFRLLGRRGAIQPGLRVADFREQRGIYILYSNYGPYYVGLTLRQNLGKRLKDHREDEHKGNWDRFSWFGFRAVLQSKETQTGLRKLKELASVSLGDPAHAISDMEAVLIKAMALQNKSDRNFKKAAEWTQIPLDEVDHFLNKIKSTRTE